MAIRLRLDVLLAERKLTLQELARRVGVTPANLSVLKNDRARAIRFSTLEALCRELDCQPGDLLVHEPEEPARDADRAPPRPRGDRGAPPLRPPQ